jgi:hypothetical protein
MHGGLLSAINFHTVFGAFRNRMVIIPDSTYDWREIADSRNDDIED